ncbi:hypothetical protein Dsin_006456 [Dipteronia sinensis]|uniref:Thioredoxin domain-containing protein n=1 Tax=Dipteronia sinensis TaxID=43782 RepID=A0AAE0AZV1_9ROSI|nr:hypothetical protein Dsin_006456 [Dipteronia sinensis]
MEGGEENKKKGLEGTGLNLPLNRHGNLKSASTDDNLQDILLQIKSSKSPVSVTNPLSFSLNLATESLISVFFDSLFLQAVLNYGASWCRVCSQILPAFCKLSNNFPKLAFVYADIDECPETTQHIRYTPTFHFYRDGERVDEMFGAGEQRLHDRLWLHS